MTANTLSIEQRCDAARAVTDQPWKYLRGHIILDGDNELHYWQPDFSIDRANWFICRDQALALVEWVFAKLDDMHRRNLFSQDSGAENLFLYRNELEKVAEAFNAKDAAALESMVFQMITKGKEDE